MTANIFVDTNILVYAKDSTDPEKQAIAENVLKDLWVKRIGKISIQVCNEYYVTVTRKLKPGMSEMEAWEDIKALSAWKPIAIDLKTIHQAKSVQERYGLSWWDSVIIASAHYSECSAILSEDLKHKQSYFGIEIVNPFLD